MNRLAELSITWELAVANLVELFNQDAPETVYQASRARCRALRLEREALIPCSETEEADYRVNVI